jgi:protein TonB
LQQAKRFPETARARGDEGRAVVRLSIQRSGALGHAQVVRSSGSALLDQAALDTVRRAAPFPPLPAEIAGAALVLNAPMNFKQESSY